MKPRIPYTKPSISNLEVEYATDAAQNVVLAAKGTRLVIFIPEMRIR